MFLEAVIGVMVIYLLCKLIATPEGLPPGFWGLPFIGYVPILFWKPVEETVDDFLKKYGDAPIVTWRMGTQVVVFILRADLIREAFMGNDFVDRPAMRVFGFVGGSSLGIVLGNGIPWRNTRSFTIHHLRDLGLGQSSLLPVIQTEAGKIVEEMKSKAGKPSKLPQSLMVAPLNVLWQLVAGKRYELNDPELEQYLKRMYPVRKTMFGITVIDFMPWLSKVLPEFIQKALLYDPKVLEDYGSYTINLIKKNIDEHVQKIDYDNPRDYIDDYLLEIKNKENDPESTFSMDDLIISVSDLFGAGFEATSMTLAWMILYLAHYPEVQKRIQKEVDSNLDIGFIASQNLIKIIPYSEAFIHEVMRHATTLPLGVMHKASNDVSFAGYKIPKDTVLTALPILTNFNPKYWENPKEFRPERFIDEDGNFLPPKNKGFYPFGIGKRVCIGENLARVELLIFLSTIVQHIEFSPPPGKKIDMSVRQNTFTRYANLDQEIMMTLR